jgi:hypothetical protein
LNRISEDSAINESSQNRRTNMNVLVSCVLFGLLASSHANYRVSFNNNFRLNGQVRQRQHVGGSDEMETYLVGIESIDEERDDTVDHLVGFRAALFHKIAHHGECKIKLVETQEYRCIEESDDDVPFKQGTALRRGIVDGCTNFYMVPELNWVAATSDAYTKEETYGLRLLKDGDLTKDWKIGISEEDYGPELTLQIRWLTGFANDIVGISGDTTAEIVADIEDQIANIAATKPAKYDAVFAPKAFFDDLPSSLKDKLVGEKNVTIPGLGIVARPDADGLISCFNDGLEAIRQRGQLEALCKEHKVDDCDLDGDEDDEDDDDDDDDDTTPNPDPQPNP